MLLGVELSAAADDDDSVTARKVWVVKMIGADSASFEQLD